MTQMAQRLLSARWISRADDADGAEASFGALDFSRGYRRWRGGFFRRGWRAGFLAQIPQMAQRDLSVRFARLIFRADTADGAEASFGALGFSRG